MRGWVNFIDYRYKRLRGGFRYLTMGAWEPTVQADQDRPTMRLGAG